MAMKMVSTSYLSEKAITTCIHIYNKNKTSSNFQAEQSEVLEQSGIKRTGIKQPKNIQHMEEWIEGMQMHQLT